MASEVINHAYMMRAPKNRGTTGIRRASSQGAHQGAGRWPTWRQCGRPSHTPSTSLVSPSVSLLLAVSECVLYNKRVNVSKSPSWVLGTSLANYQTGERAVGTPNL